MKAFGSLCQVSQQTPKDANEGRASSMRKCGVAEYRVKQQDGDRTSEPEQPPPFTPKGARPTTPRSARKARVSEVSQRTQPVSSKPSDNTMETEIQVKTSLPPWSEEIKKELKNFVFQDTRWTNGLAFLQRQSDWGPERAKEILRDGAKTFGLWKLSTRELQGLVDRLMNAEPKSTPALQTWIDEHADFESQKILFCTSATSTSSGGPSTGPQTPMSPIRPRWTKTAQIEKGTSSEELGGILYTSRQMACEDISAEEYNKVLTDKKMRKKKREKVFGGFGIISRLKSVYKSPLLKKIEVSIHLLVLVISILYAVKVVVEMYPDAIEIFGWPVFFARMGGMAAALWTGILYLTMSRGLLTTIITRLPHTKLTVTVSDAQKDLHIMAGWSLCVTAVEHTLAHFIGTVPGILKADLQSLNDLLGCANVDSTPGYLNAPLKFLQWPSCPLESLPERFDEALLLTMPGITGVALVFVLGVVAYTGRKAGRAKEFDRFIFLHNILVFVWPILLFLHRSNGWIGIGFPLVVFTSSFSILTYSSDRIMCRIRYFLFAGTRIRIIEATCRPGKDKPTEGCLTYLRISPPPYFWSFRPGMYALINMPEYAPLQWHPFTICSGPEDDEAVAFLIAGVGDWTRELARRCLDAKQNGKPFPKVCLDGPFAAPSQTALSKEVIVAVGAGVGITPFLSLLWSYITLLCDNIHRMPLREAHFFWITRSIDEFMFGRELLSKIVRCPGLSSKVFLHLHTTASESAKNPQSYLFREALRQQSKFDQKAFSNVYTEAKANGVQLMIGPQLPWCWVHGSKLDVIWVRHLVKARGESETLFPQEHWCSTFTNEGPSKEFSQTSKPSKATSDSLENSLENSIVIKEQDDVMVPIIFGRPDFCKEIRNIGNARPDCPVDIYICGGEKIVQTLQEAKTVCNRLAQKDAKEKGVPCRQVYSVHYERFG